VSRREQEIVALTLAGETAPAIAKALFLSERTVESHLRVPTPNSACILNSSWPGGRPSSAWPPMRPDPSLRAQMPYMYGCWHALPSVAF
jgi:Bacterial regulatory proteins, luxR family